VLIGYMRVSKADGSQAFDLQRDALLTAGVDSSRLYHDHASGKKGDRPGLEACLKSMREGDTLIVWKLDRLGRNLRHLVNTIYELMERNIGLRVLTGQGANIDTTTASGRLVFGIFAALAEFERELIRERTIAGLSSARARGRNGGRLYTMAPAKHRLAQAAMAARDTKVADLCQSWASLVRRSTVSSIPRGICVPTARSSSSAKASPSAHDTARDPAALLQ
jgi:DNA invertase Pin-like site-specific DNA recombinase